MQPNHQQLVQELAETLSQNKPLRILTGFDAFIDTLVELVHEQTENGPVFFQNFTQFGSYVQAKSGTNFSLEVVPKIEKIGGNMLIMSNAMAKLGVQVDCLGNFGQPAIHPAFAELSGNLIPHSFGQPGACMAIECGENKLMLANMTPLNEADWTLIKTEIGLKNIQSMAENAHAFCLLNWGELLKSNQIWKGFYEDILSGFRKDESLFDSSLNQKPIVFIDLSDFSNRNSADVAEMVDLLELFCLKTKVIISLNINELNLFEKYLNLNKNEFQADLILTNEQPKSPSELSINLKNLEKKSQLIQLKKRFNFELIILHSKEKSMAIHGQKMVEAEVFKLTELKFLTGAGDHFNAGFLTAYLSGFELQNCLQFGNALAGMYIEGKF